MPSDERVDRVVPEADLGCLTDLSARLKSCYSTPRHSHPFLRPFWPRDFSHRQNRGDSVTISICNGNSDTQGDSTQHTDPSGDSSHRDQPRSKAFICREMYGADRKRAGMRVS